MTDNNKSKILKEITHNIIDENKDSLTIGSATKGGAIKVYGSLDKPEQFKAKIDKAIELRKYANLQINI